MEHPPETITRRQIECLRDAPFDQPVLSKFASDGTLELLAYLTVLYDPEPPQFIGAEEPESFLHPRLLPELGEECRAATERSQLLVSTHLPMFIDALRPHEVGVMYRSERGFAQITRAADVRGVEEFVESGVSLGHLLA
jgi:predicted ATPase